jgi:hypothetical protein
MSVWRLPEGASEPPPRDRQGGAVGMGLYLTDLGRRGGAVTARRDGPSGVLPRFYSRRSRALSGGSAPPPSRISVVASHSSGHSGGDESFGWPREPVFRQERSE